MIFYKIVQSDINGRLYSCVAKGKARIAYSTKYYSKSKKWLKEKGYGILVFQDEASAEQFYVRSDSAWKIGKEIWECNVRGEIKQKWSELPTLLDYTSIPYGEFIKDIYHWWPIGTVMADEVRLRRRIK